MHKLVLMLFCGLIFSQSIDVKIYVYDKYDIRPIENVEVLSKDYKVFTDKNGYALFHLGKDKSIVFKHINYSELSFNANALPDTVFLTPAYFKTNVTVSADRIELSEASVSEVKQEKMLSSPFILQAIPDVNTSLKTLSQVHVSEDINGQNYVNVLSGNDNEVRYFINGMNLFLYSEQLNYSSLMLTQLIKELSLDIGSYDNFLASINFQIQQESKPEISIQKGENLNAYTANYSFRLGNFLNISGMKYLNQYHENKVEDFSGTYNYDFQSEKKTFNNFSVFQKGQTNVQNIFLYENRKNYYLSSIDLEDKIFTNGFIYRQNDWTVKHELMNKNSHYRNVSKDTFKEIRKTYGMQNRLSISNTFGDSIKGLYSEFEILRLDEKYNNFYNSELNERNANDTQFGLLFKKKFIPEKSMAEERKTVFEIDLSLAQYDDSFFVKSLGLKSVLIFELEPIVLDFYSDLNFGKVPLYDVNKLYMNAKNDSISDYIENTNMSFGVKTNYKKLALDVSYSIRDYSSFLNKNYGIIFHSYRMNFSNSLSSLNIKLDYIMNDYIKANSAFQITSADDIKQFSNKPEFVQSYNLSLNYNEYELLLNLKNEKNKYLVYDIDNILYQRKITDSKDLSLYLNARNKLLNGLNISLAINNLLQEEIYTLNGFYTTKLKTVLMVRYEL